MENEDCPNCLGTGNKLMTREVMHKCSYCKGKGEVSTDAYNVFLENYLYDDI